MLKLREAQIKDLKQSLLQLDPAIKLVCVCGNHDVGDIPTVESIDTYRTDFGDDFFSFWNSGCKFLVLNSQMYFNSSKIPELKKEQDAWLDKELHSDTAGHKHLVVFQHIPLFIETADEPDHIYFNIPLSERKGLIERFKKAQVRKVFCGHYHRNAGGFDGDLECVVTTAIGAQIGSDGHGYRLVQVDDDDIKHRFITVTDKIN